MKLLFSLLIGFTLMFAVVFSTANLWAYSDAHENHAYHEVEEDTVWLNPIYNSSEDTTIYTTDTLDTPGSIRLHEIYFRLEYKDGIVPNTDHFISAMSVQGHGSGYMVLASECQLGVQGQNLIVSCGFINSNLEFTDENHTWSFIVRGNEPLEAIRTVATYRKNIAGSMPDYEASQTVDLHTIDDTEDILAEVSCAAIDDFQALTSSKKVIILIHGWNPGEKDNHYGAPRDDESDPLCLPLEGGEPEGEDDEIRNDFAFQHLMVNLMNNPAVKNKWAVARYDWHNDAMTGEGLLEDSNASRDAAHVHGKKLGSLLASLNVEKVHFIAHSAGNWVARRASEYLNLYRGDSCEIQVTSLDPFVNDDADTIGIDAFDLEPDFELMPNFVDRLDNYYAEDSTDSLYGWTSGDFDGWLNQNIENLNGATCYLPFMDDHAGPIYWYAMSADTDESQSLKSLRLGFYNSLAWEEYVAPMPWIQLLLLNGSGDNLGSSKVPDTGQTICYDAVGNIINPCPSEGQDFYGQDACYTINPPSYTKLDSNGNELPFSAADWAMVKDNVTGLIWEKKTDDGSIHDWCNQYNWYDASAVFVAQLNSNSFGGYSDWRMPTVNELRSIVHYEIYSPAINLYYFPYTMASWYWPSATCAGYPDSAWFVDFYNGFVSGSSKSNSVYVRAVRSGQ